MEEIAFDKESDVESATLEMNLEVDNKGTVNESRRSSWRWRFRGAS